MNKMQFLTSASAIRRASVIAAVLATGFGAERAMAQRPLGVDVSSYQGSGINWSSVRGAGITFAWAKATEGTYDDDADFTINENKGKGAGVVMGAYHFARPDLDSPGTEASFFWSAAGNYIQADGKTLMPMLDMETWNGVVGASTYSQWANDWNNDVVADAAGQGVSIKPFIYVSACSACNFDTSVSGWLSDIANYNGENPQTGGPWNVCGNCGVWGSGVWTAWQYTSTGSVSGIAGNVDRDVLGGSLSAVIAGSTGNPHINPCIARTSDGRQTIFAIGHTGNLYQNYQTAPNSGWSGWQAMGNSGNVWTQNGIPAVGTNSDGRLELFIVGTDGSVNHIWQLHPGSNASTNWSSFTTFSSHVNQTVKLAVGKFANGALDVFVIGTDGALYHNYQGSSGWTGFQSLGGNWNQNTDIAVNNELDGREEVFLVGTTGNLYNNWQTTANGTSWNGWHDLSGALSDTVRIAVGRNSDGRLEAFTIGTDGVSYHEWETAANSPTSWSAWSSLAGSWETDAKTCVAADANGALEVFLIGHTGNVYHNYQNGSGWSGWLGLGGSFTQNIRPCVGQNADGRLEIFLTGPNTDMLHAYETSPNSTSWSGWGSLGGSWD